MMASHFCRRGCRMAALLLLFAGLAVGQNSSADDPAAARLASDVEFVREAAASGNLEIQMSRIAAIRANSERIREYAAGLAEDRSKVRRKLKEIAWSKNVEISDALDPQRMHRLLLLQRYTGDEFDREYLTLQVDQQRRALQLFQEHTQKNGDTELRDFAQTKLPALEAHLRLTQTLADGR